MRLQLQQVGQGQAAQTQGAELEEVAAGEAVAEVQGVRTGEVSIGGFLSNLVGVRPGRQWWK